MYNRLRNSANQEEVASNIASHGGYDCDFAEPPPAGLVCLICTFVAREPMQMDCCGKVYCKACLTQFKKTSNNCLNCSEEGHGFNDKRSDREIKVLKVKCANRNSSCAWVGELWTLDYHHDTCDHALLPCPIQCKDGNSKTVQVLRKDLATHLKEKCPNRSYQCPHCREEGKHCDITTSHLETCPQLEVPCPNEGCSERVPQCDIAEHRKTCPLERIACKYSTIGCKQKLLRKELKEHESNDQLHLHIAMETVLKVQTQLIQIKSEIKLIRTTASSHFTFKMTNFSQYKESGEDFYSPPFYTHQGGYKMCINACANGKHTGKGTHISVYARLMRGENDEYLTWPFTGTVTVELLNQLEDTAHYLVKLPYPEGKDDEANRRVVDGERAVSGYGTPTFVPHTALGHHPSITIKYRFLKDDCLFFRVSVKATPNPKPWLTCTS